MKKVLLSFLFISLYSLPLFAEGFAQSIIIPRFIGSTSGGSGATLRVTVPTGAVAVWLMNEGVGTNTFEYYFSTRTGTFAGDSTAITWNSTGGARGYAAISNRPTTGYVSIANDPTWMSPDVNGAFTWMACVEPRNLSANRGFISHEDNSGTLYEWVLWYQNSGNVVQSRLSTSVGAGISTMNSDIGALTQGARNSMVTRYHSAQPSGSRTKMWINNALMGNASSEGAGSPTASTVDMRFGLLGSDPNTYADSNMSFYILLYRNVTAAEITTFHNDCIALTP